LKLFLQFDKEYLIIPLESMAIYGIMQEIDEFINFKRNQRTFALMEHRNSVRFLGKQPNLIVNQGSIRETSIGRNHVSRLFVVKLGQDTV
jgi:hypothetical protein